MAGAGPLTHPSSFILVEGRGKRRCAADEHLAGVEPGNKSFADQVCPDYKRPSYLNRTCALPSPLRGEGNAQG